MISSETANEYVEPCIKEIYKEKGCDTVSFTPITAYGKGGADPHHETDDTKGKYGDGAIKISCTHGGENFERTIKIKVLPVKEKVAKIIIKALKHKKRIAIIDWKFHLLVILWKLIPSCIWERISVKN